MDVTGRASKLKKSLNLDLFLKHGAFFCQRSENFFFLKLFFIKTKIMFFLKVNAPTNREKNITYFLIVHPQGTHVENSTITMKIGGENRTVIILLLQRSLEALKICLLFLIQPIAMLKFLTYPRMFGMSKENS